MPPKPKGLRERFAEKVAREGDCLVWQAARNSAGYGQIGSGPREDGQPGVTLYAHRLAWEWANGSPIPKGHHIDHLCRNTLCVEPSHLELVTHGENIRRGNAHHSRSGTGRYGKTTCRAGHVREVGKPCKPCKADSQRRRRAERKRERGQDDAA